MTIDWINLLFRNQLLLSAEKLKATFHEDQSNKSQTQTSTASNSILLNHSMESDDEKQANA